MSQDNVWEWLLEQSVFQLLLKSRQRIGRRDIVRKPVPELYCATGNARPPTIDSLNGGICRPCVLSPLRWCLNVFMSLYHTLSVLFFTYSLVGLVYVRSSIFRCNDNAHYVHVGFYESSDSLKKQETRTLEKPTINETLFQIINRSWLYS